MVTRFLEPDEYSKYMLKYLQIAAEMESGTGDILCYIWYFVTLWKKNCVVNECSGMGSCYVMLFSHLSLIWFQKREETLI